jgi:hypothetical protein
VSFAAITLCVASQIVFIFVAAYFVMTRSGNFWTHSGRVFTSHDQNAQNNITLMIHNKGKGKVVPVLN